MKAKRKLLAWSIGSGLLISSALYSGVSLAYVNKANLNNHIDSQDSKNNIEITKPLSFNEKNIAVIPLIEANGVYEINNNDLVKEDLFTTIKDNASVFYVTDSNLNIEKARINKKGNTSSLFQSNTTGLNSSLLVKDKGSLNVYRSNIKTNGLGAKGVYVSGLNSKAVINETIIETNNEDSNGLESADSSKIISNNIAINTNGKHSIGIASSNKGTLINNKGYIFTTGELSPAFYSAGNMIIENTDIETLSSPIGLLEGGNNVVLKDNNMKGNEGIKIVNVLPEKERAILNISKGYLAVKNDYTFNVDNASALIRLEKVKIKNENNKLINMVSSTPNNVEINIKNQYLKGDINNDINSKIVLTMNNGSIYEGCIINGASICFDRTSKWDVKGASHVGAINIPDDDVANIDRYIKTNGYKIKYEVESNKWLKGKKVRFKDGGYLIPA